MRLHRALIAAAFAFGLGGAASASPAAQAGDLHAEYMKKDKGFEHYKPHKMRFHKVKFKRAKHYRHYGYHRHRFYRARYHPPRGYGYRYGHYRPRY